MGYGRTPETVARRGPETHSEETRRKISASMLGKNTGPQSLDHLAHRRAAIAEEWAHRDRGPTACDRCGREFKGAQGLKIHTTKVHGLVENGDAV